MNGDDNCSGSFLAQDIQQGSSKHDFKGSKFLGIFVCDKHTGDGIWLRKKYKGKIFCTR